MCEAECACVCVCVFFMRRGIKPKKKKKILHIFHGGDRGSHVVNDANLMKPVLGKKMPLAFHPRNVYSTSSGNRVVLGVL